MANYKAIIPHMLKWEGGYSSDPNDEARSTSTSKLLNGHPIHTNKGITYATWLNSASTLGHPKTEQAFLNMTSAQWGKIMKKFFWDYAWGDQIQSQAIAEILTEIVWGSGPRGLKPNVILLQKYLKDRGYDPKGIDGFMGNDTVKALNQFLYDKGAKGEKEIVDLIWNNRANQLKGYPTAKDHLKGWMNRMNDWYKNSSDRIKQFIKDNPTGTGILGSVVFLAGLLLLSKKFIK
jgi:lysozyme family protein